MYWYALLEQVSIDEMSTLLNTYLRDANAAMKVCGGRPVEHTESRNTPLLSKTTPLWSTTERTNYSTSLPPYLNGGREWSRVVEIAG